VPTSAGIALVADDMVAVLLGRQWLPAAPPLRLISLYAAVRVIDGGLSSLMLATTGEVPILVLCLAIDRDAGAAVLGAAWDGATGLIVFYTTAYCAVMIFLAKEALAELREKFS
jgi:O-antigen/teichoic acid export membrane protein